MAEIPYVVKHGKTGDGSASAQGTLVIVWEGLANGDTGQPYFGIDYPDKSVQIIGDFNSETITIQGSNDPDTSGQTWTSLTDPQGNPIAKTSAAIEQILENPHQIRPSISGSSGGDVDVLMTISTVARR